MASSNSPATLTEAEARRQRLEARKAKKAAKASAKRPAMLDFRQRRGTVEKQVQRVELTHQVWYIRVAL